MSMSPPCLSGIWVAQLLGLVPGCDGLAGKTRREERGTDIDYCSRERDVLKKQGPILPDRQLNDRPNRPAGVNLLWQTAAEAIKAKGGPD